MAWTACQKAEEEFIEEQSQEQTVEETVWSLTVPAIKEDTPQTKGLALDGAEATATTLQSIWKVNETVEVYLGTTHIGTLTATPDGSDAHKATLSGTISTSETITPKVTTLTLLTPRETWDYTGQTGVLLSDANSIEKKFHYTMATSVLVKDYEGTTLTTGAATFQNQQSIYRLSFRFQKAGASEKTAINAQTVTIASAHLAGTTTLNAGSVTDNLVDAIEVDLASSTTDPIFVALRMASNQPAEGAETLTFTVIDNEGATYKGSKDVPAANKGNGVFVSIKNATISRLDMEVSSATTATAL